jgi:hypothetical protein
MKSMLPLLPKTQTVQYLSTVVDRLTLQAMQMDPREHRVLELVHQADQLRAAIDVIRSMREDEAHTDTPLMLRALP